MQTINVPYDTQRYFQVITSIFRWGCHFLLKCFIDYIDKMVLLSDDTEDNSKFKDALVEIDQNWYLGMDSENEWRRAVLQETPFLFCINSVDTASATGTYIKQLINWSREIEN